MNQMQFETERRPTWSRFDSALQKPGRKNQSVADLPSLYREVSRDLAMARERNFHPRLQAELNRLVLRGHHVMYGQRRSPWIGVTEFLVAGFPILVRSRWKKLLFCLAFFYGPFIGLWAAGKWAPEWIFAVLPEAHMASLDSMYDGERGWLSRGASEGFAGVAFYLNHNVSIAFRAFASGILAGIGSLFMLGYNGVVLGASFGYIVYAGHTERFLAFVSGHSALELSGIVLAGLAGLELGLAWLMPGRKTRRYGLVSGARDALKILLGGAFMVSCAAVIEAYFSPSPLPDAVKHWVGIGLWVFVLVYFAFAGRRRATR